MKRARMLFVALVILVSGAVSLAAESQIAEALQPFVESGAMPGFVSVLADADAVFQVDCLGYADIEAQRPMTPDTLFWIASTTKIFTSAAVMTLVEQGKIDLDAPLEQYLPEFRGYKVAVPNGDGTALLREPSMKPTVRQALCHTAGWTFRAPWQAVFGIDALDTRKAACCFASFPMVRDPGTQYEYSQVGIDLAGAVVEAVSGMPYHEYLQKTFFDPMGMTRTTFWPSPEAQTGMAFSYRWNQSAGRLEKTNIGLISYPLEDRTKRFAEPGGGLFSTPNDIVKFFQMLAGKGEFQGKRYLSEESVAEIARKQTPTNGPSYGLCAFINGDWFGHGGAYGNDSLVNAKTGQVAIYVVQVTGVPEQGKAKNAWMNVAKAILEARATAQSGEEK